MSLKSFAQPLVFRTLLMIGCGHSALCSASDKSDLQIVSGRRTQENERKRTPLMRRRLLRCTVFVPLHSIPLQTPEAPFREHESYLIRILFNEFCVYQPVHNGAELVR